MKKIEVLCNQDMLNLLTPIEVSQPIPHYDYGPEFVAVYDEAALKALPESSFEGCGPWWRGVGPANIPIEWDQRRIEREGVWSYLCAEYGISTERNRAIAVYELANDLGVSPVELGNRLAALTETTAGVKS